MNDSEKARPGGDSPEKKNRFFVGDIVFMPKKIKPGTEGGFCRACGARYDIEMPLCPLCRAGIEHKHPFNK